MPCLVCTLMLTSLLLLTLLGGWCAYVHVEKQALDKGTVRVLSLARQLLVSRVNVRVYTR